MERTEVIKKIKIEKNLEKVKNRFLMNILR